LILSNIIALVLVLLSFFIAVVAIYESRMFSIERGGEFLVQLRGGQVKKKKTPYNWLGVLYFVIKNTF
jgi:hypothetical protein